VHAVEVGVRLIVACSLPGFFDIVNTVKRPLGLRSPLQRDSRGGPRKAASRTSDLAGQFGLRSIR